MDLPEEDSLALRKRSAIQSVMKDKSLSGGERHVKIQQIMRGNFDDVEESESESSEDEGSSYATESGDESESDDSSRSSYDSSSGYDGRNDERGNETNDEDDDDSSSGSSRSTTETEGDDNESNVIMSRSGNVNDKSTTALQSSSLESIIRQVQTNDPSLTTIHFSSQNLSDTDLLPLFTALSSNTHVTTLSLPNNQLTNAGCRALASTLLDNSKLSTLDLSNNTKIDTEGIEELTKALPYNYTLKVLSMNNIGSNFGKGGAREVAVALAQNESLRELYLNGNDIGNGDDDIGALLLFQMLASDNTTLEKLSLCHNGIGDKGAHAFANALCDNETLKSVDLSENVIGEGGAKDILKVLSVNETLEELGLQGNGGIGEGIMGEIERAIVEGGGGDDDDSSESEGSSYESRSSRSGDESSASSRSSRSYESGSDSDSDSAADVESITVDDDDEEEDGGGGAAPAQLTGGEAMLTDMPDEDNKALAKRQLIQQIMKDKSLSAADRNKKIQDVMAGRVELPKVEKKAAPKEESSPPAGSSEDAGDAQLTGGEAMLTDMPDEDNKALAKRQLIQQIMKDKSLSAADRNKKIQDVMAGRVELPKVEKKAAPKEESSPPAGSSEDAGDAQLTGGEAMLTDMPDEDKKALAKRQLIQQIMKDKSLSAADRNKKIQDVMAGRVELPKVEKKAAPKEESSPPASNSDEAGDAQLTGGEAMLTDMPDEDKKALAKRQLIQQIMKDKSLSAADRNKKIQDVMAGRVELPKVEPKPAEVASVPVKVDNQPEPSKPKKGKRNKSKSVPTAGDKNESNDERKKALQAVMTDTSLSAPERQQKIQEIMEGEKSNRAGQVQEANDDIAQKVRERKSKQRNKVPVANDGVAPTNVIAQEWKRKMMEPHPRSQDDLLDILLAHKYRLSLRSPPNQSCFRVVAVVFFSLVVNGIRRSERYHVVGTNDEPHSIAGSICAERAALMQLRFMPNLESITKIVIVTDDADAVSPGMLCREFMASHDRVPWDVPIILGRSVCKKCGFSITGNVCGDAMSCFSDTEEFQEAQSNIFAMCSAGHEESKYKQYTTPHDFLGTATTLRELFPYPSLYTRLSARESLQLGERYLESDPQRKNSPQKKKSMDTLNVLADKNNDVSDDASARSAGSFRQEKFDLTMLTDILEEEEAENVGGDKKKRPLEEKRSSFVSPSQITSSMTHSLKTTIDFMRQIQEDTGNSTPSNGLGVVPDSLDRLTASKIRISSRLKPSQRREKLLKMATEATVYESHQRHAHPIRYGAAVLFSDNTVSIASQKVAIEYGCTLDAVGQLASIIDRKAMQLDDHKPAVRPILLVQCDQFGIAHPPFAQGRAFLTERGYGDCKILLHQQRQSRPYPTIMEETSMRDFDEEEKKDEGKVDLRLIEVDANGLAPSPPDIFGVVKGTKMHSSTLQIQF